MKPFSIAPIQFVILLGLLSGFSLSQTSWALSLSQNCNKYEAAFREDIPTSKILLWSGVATLASSVVHGEDKSRENESQSHSIATGLIGIGTSLTAARQTCSSESSELASQVAVDELNPEDTVEKREHLRAITAQAVALNALANIVLYSNSKNLNVKSIATIGAVLPIGLLTYYWDDFQVLEPAEDDASIAFQIDSQQSMLFVRWSF